MKNTQGFYDQLRSAAPVLMKLYAPALLLLFGIGLARVIGDVNIGKITRDPAQAVGHHPFVGLLSNIGLLLWCASSAICVFCFAALRHDATKRNVAALLLAAASISSILLLDDYFLLHDFVVPTYLHVSEKAVYGVYGIGAFAFLMGFQSTIVRTEYVILALAFVFFALSTLFDVIPAYVPGHFLFEDGFKLLGIMSWVCYFTRVSLQYLEPGRQHLGA